MQIHRCPCCGSDVSGRDRPWISLDTNKLMAGGEIVKLSPTEAEIVHSLAEAMPLPVAHERMFAKIWGANPINDPQNTIHVYVCKINKKIRQAGLVITSIWGAGYRLEYLRSA